MSEDKLYQKSVTAVFLLMVVGISLFFYSAYLAEQKRNVVLEEINQQNLTALLEKSETAGEKPLPENLDGIDNFPEEAPLLDTAADPSKTQSSKELENLLKEFE